MQAQPQPRQPQRCERSHTPWVGCSARTWQTPVRTRSRQICPTPTCARPPARPKRQRRCQRNCFRDLCETGDSCLLFRLRQPAAGTRSAVGLARLPKHEDGKPRTRSSMAVVGTGRALTEAAYGMRRVQSDQPATDSPSTGFAPNLHQADAVHILTALPSSRVGRVFQ